MSNYRGKKRKAPPAPVEEEEAFPRGGSNRPAPDAAATPADKAKPDFLFNTRNETTKKQRITADGRGKGKKKDSKKRKGKKSNDAIAAAMERKFDLTKAPRNAELLSFKKLKIGMQVLGTVRSVRAATIVVSLPHNLSGFVPAACVSAELGASVTQAVDGGNADDGDDETAPRKSLDALFTPGQIVSCVVVKLAPEASKRRIQLSMLPEQVNAGRPLASLAEGQVMVASVRSLEDHGYVMHTGIEGANAFMKYDEDSPKHRVGDLVTCVVSKVMAAMKTIQLSSNPEAVRKAQTKALPRKASMALSLVKPGMLANTRVLKVISNGLYVQLLGIFTGTVDYFHLLKPAAHGWRSAYSEGQRLRCRILFVDLAGKKIGLSAAPHMVKMAPVAFDGEFGSVWRNSVVLRIDNSLGMLIGKKADDADADDAAEGDDGSDSDENMGDESKGTEGASTAVSDWGRTGYVHISRVADGRIDHLERKFKVGQAVASRILGFSSLDGIANLSLRPSIVNAAVLRYEDLTPGMLVPGKVERVGAFGVVVALSELVQGLVTPMHLADSKLRKASAMYRAGKKVKARVLTVDPANHSVLLTLMPSLVKSELPLVVSYPDGKQSTGVATVGSVVHGFVTALRPTGVIVTFYNNVHGLVPLADLTKQGIDNLKSAFYVGKPVKCRITRADAARHRLALSLATAGGASSAPTDAGDVDAFTPGMVVEGAVVSVPAGTNADDYVVVELTDGDKSARAQLPVAHLCDHLDSCSRLASGLAVGDTFPQLLVVETSRGASKVGRPALVVSAKPLLINAPKSALPATLDDVMEGTVVCGVVSHIATFGLFVRFLGGVTGLAPKANIADTFVSDAAAFFQPGQSVRGVVVGIDRERGKFEVSLKPSVLDATTGVPAEVTTAAASALYLQSLLDVEERIAAAATAGADDGSDAESDDEGSDEEGSDEEGSDDDDAGAAPESSPMDEYTPGAIVTGTVDTVKEYGVLVELPNGATGFVVTEHLDGASVEAGDSVKARVLDVDHAAGLVDLTLRGELVAAGEADAKAAKKSKKKKSKKKSKPAADTLAVGSELRARVEVVHAGRYAVVSLPSHGSAIALASITEPNRPSQPAIDGDAGVGATVAVVVTSVPADGEEGTITVSVVPPTKRRTRAGAGAGAGAGSAKPKPEKVQTPAAALEPGMIVEAVPAAKPSLGSDLSVQLKHVSGRYAARLALCEVVEFGDEPASPDTEALSKFLALKPGRKFTAKVVCAAVNAADAKKQQKRQSKAASGDADAAAATEPLVEVYLTIRAADLALPAGELATVRPSVDAEGAGVTDKSNPVSPAAVGVVPGCVAVAVVQTVNVSHLVVGLGGAVTGVVPLLAAGSLDDAGTPLAERFEVGQTTRCVCTSATGASRVRMAIAGADAALSAAVAAVRKSRSKQAKKLAATALKASLKALEGVDSAADAQRDQDVDVGAVVVGKVLRVDINVDDSKKAMRGKGKRPAQRAPVGTLTLDLGAGRKGRVCITHTADQAEWSDFPLSKFSPGQFVRGVVLSATEVSDTNKTKKGKKQSKKQSKASQFVEVSLRRSLVDQAQAEGTDAAAASAAEVLKADTAAATAVGEVVTGFVVNTMPKGCFVRLGAGITARVKVSHLADGFVKEIAVSFPPGKLVAGRVLSHDADTGLTELTLKPSRVVGAARDALFASLERGQAFPAKVTRVETYGVFAELQVPKEEGSGMRGSGLTGLCHVKEVADEYVADLTKAYTIGDDVRVIVLEVDTEKKRVSLGMKPSYFENEDSDDEAMDGVKVLQPVDADSSDDELVQGGDANDSSDDDDASGSGSGEESGSDSDDDAAGNGPTSTLDVSGLAAEVAASDDSGSDEEDVVGASTNGLSVGFNWASGEAADEDEDMGSDGDASDSGSDSDSDDDANAGAGKSKRNKQAAARREEEAVRAKELELLSADVVPEAEADFERLIVADPNNSFLWIKFMAFQLSRTEVEKARVIARRALKTISFRDEQEKLNIWVALLNLEHQYGDKDTLAAVFSEAQQHNDPKQVFLQMINIYERAHADEDADALHAIAARKFGSSKTIWINWARHRFVTGNEAGARELLARAMKVLEQRKHLETVSKFAILEFKHGTVERGRTMFEGIVSSYPKRVDMWNMYLDQEISRGDVDTARRLFERATSLKLSSKKMKFFFKKFLAFEREHGSKQTVREVTERARAYVESVLQN